MWKKLNSVEDFVLLPAIVLIHIHEKLWMRLWKEKNPKKCYQFSYDQVCYPPFLVGETEKPAYQVVLCTVDAQWTRYQKQLSEFLKKSWICPPSASVTSVIETNIHSPFYILLTTPFSKLYLNICGVQKFPLTQVPVLLWVQAKAIKMAGQV